MHAYFFSAQRPVCGVVGFFELSPFRFFAGSAGVPCAFTKRLKYSVRSTRWPRSQQSGALIEKRNLMFLGAVARAWMVFGRKKGELPPLFFIQLCRVRLAHGRIRDERPDATWAGSGAEAAADAFFSIADHGEFIIWQCLARDRSARADGLADAAIPAHSARGAFFGALAQTAETAQTWIKIGQVHTRIVNGFRHMIAWVHVF